MIRCRRWPPNGAPVDISTLNDASATYSIRLPLSLNNVMAVFQLPPAQKNRFTDHSSPLPKLESVGTLGAALDPWVHPVMYVARSARRMLHSNTSMHRKTGWDAGLAASQCFAMEQMRGRLPKKEHASERPMKLRIKRNLLEFRISRTELSRLSEAGHLEETIYLSRDRGSKLVYRLGAESSSQNARLVYDSPEVLIVLPLDAVREWAKSDRSGMYAAIDLGKRGVLEAFVEKDFADGKGSGAAAVRKQGEVQRSKSAATDASANSPHPPTGSRFGRSGAR